MRIYSKKEEIYNSFSHGIGSLLSIVGTAVGVTLASCYGDWVGITAILIYGLSLVLLYTMSTLYHAIPSAELKRIFRIFDHASIFLLIAGSYTPICMIALQGNDKGILILSIVWVCAVLGIILNVISLERFDKLSLLLYIAMGWAVCFILPDVLKAISQEAFIYLLAGGIAYTGGIVFYCLRKPYMHCIWHLWVLFGSILHYICNVVYVLPMNYAFF